MYEIAVGSPAFKTDMAIFEACILGNSLDLNLVHNIFQDDPQTEERICGEIASMVAFDPTSRPSASSLGLEFSKYLGFEPKEDDDISISFSSDKLPPTGSRGREVPEPTQSKGIIRIPVQ